MVTIAAVLLFAFGASYLVVQLLGSSPFSLVLGIALGLRGARAALLLRASGIALVVVAIVLLPSLLTHWSWWPTERDSPIPSRHGETIQLFIWPPEIALGMAFALYGASGKNDAGTFLSWIAGLALGLCAEAFFWREILRSFLIEMARPSRSTTFDGMAEMLIATTIASYFALLLLVLPGWAVGRVAYRIAGRRAGCDAAPLPFAWLIWPAWIATVLTTRASIGG